MSMRKIVVGAMASIDGVMQAPGGPTEDPTKGFRLGGWVMPHFDEEGGAEMGRLFAEEFDLLLGRKTYETFAAYWPYYDKSGPDGDIARAFDRCRKYVVSRSGEVDTGWKNSVLLRDIEGVRHLRAEPGPTLLTQGSTELVHTLLAEDLVDTLSIFTFPVVLGGGKKLFADGSAPHAYRLVRSVATKAGVVVGHYERGGDVPLAPAGPPSTSAAEAARQERMKREG
jgi:dihydrofolate reductase